MGEKTNISWTDSTVNFWEGCTQVSPACANCYAMERDKRWHKGIHWGKGAPRRRSKSAESTARRLNALAGKTPGNVHRVFSLSLGDWLDEEVPIEWLGDMLKVVSETPNLTWLLLTKRPENFEKRLDQIRIKDKAFGAWLIAWILFDKGEFMGGAIDGWRGEPPANVHIGVTVENQAMADKRLPDLLKIPAHRRFLSCEPLLSKIHFDSLDGIHQVIVGGESGPCHRPLSLDWVRSIKEQCNAAGVAYFSKQDSGPRAGLRGRIPDDLWVQEGTQ